MKTFRLIISIFLAATLSLWVNAQNGDRNSKISESVDALVNSPNLKGASVGILAVTVGGDTLARVNADRTFVPASNMKAITTALALRTLGYDYEFETIIGYSGQIKDRVLHGDLYIIGTGDPTFGGSKISCNAEMAFDGFSQHLMDHGIHEIDGWVIGDGRAFTQNQLGSWEFDDCMTYFGSGASALNFYENRIDFKVSAGKKVGDPLNVQQVYPPTPWMSTDFSCTTGPKGSGNTLYYYSYDLCNKAQMRGTFAIDRQPKTEMAANRFPEYTCAALFCEHLERVHIPCTKGPADTGFFAPEDGWEPCPADSLKLLVANISPSLLSIAKLTNYDSNNLFADALFKKIGLTYMGKSDYASCSEAFMQMFQELGLDTRGIQVADGSGLTRRNWVSPEFFCAFLKRMIDEPCFEDFVYTLPYPSAEGTLKNMLKGLDEQTKLRIHLKSGSMDGVRCYCGYIIPASEQKDDAIVLSLMINNCTAPTQQIMPLIEAVVAALAE